MDENKEVTYTLVCPFYIDTDAYSDRDRLMFVAGFQFNEVYQAMKTVGNEIEFTIYRENESRIKLAAARLSRRVEIGHYNQKLDPDQIYAQLKILHN